MELKNCNMKKFELDSEDKNALEISAYVLETLMNQLNGNNQVVINGVYDFRIYNSVSHKFLKEVKEMLIDIEHGLIMLEEK